MDDDAQIYIRNSIIETLFSFYVCPLSDNNSKALILQVVNMPIKMSYVFSGILLYLTGLRQFLAIFLHNFSENSGNFFLDIICFLVPFNKILWFIKASWSC